MYEKYTVMFVDDEVNILQSIRRGLIDEEYKVLCAESGKEAIELMEKNNVDVIVTDMRMPEMNGLQLLHVIAEHWPETIKIVLTGFTQHYQIVATVNQIDIFKFLLKPWQLDELVMTIHKALDLHIMRSENEHYNEVLENQNKMYQALLKKFENAIVKSKFNTDFLGVSGKALLEFGRDFDQPQQDKYRRLLNMRVGLFEELTKSLSDDRTEITAEEINKRLGLYITKLAPKATLTMMSGSELHLKISIKTLETALRTVITVFDDEITAGGVYIYMGVATGSTYSILVQTSFVAATREGELLKDQVKSRFIMDILKVPLEMSHMIIRDIEKPGSYLFTINIEGKK